jgi:peptidyl-prolyl cis-trans isomerase D
VAARLKQGEAPAAVAKSLGVDAIIYDAKPLTAVADRKVGQAAFRMQAGEVGAVQGDLGLAVVKIVSVTPGRDVSLEEARPMLEAEIRKDMVAEKVYAQTQAYDDAHQAGASLADAAAKAGVPAQTLGPITAQAIDEQGRQYQLPPKILETAFGLPAGGESEITDLGDGAYFAVKVDKIVPAHVPPLAEIRDRVTLVYMQRQVINALEAKSAALAARLKKGEAIDAVAASAGASVSRITGLSRQTAQSQQEALGAELLSRAFAAKPGDAWTARAPNGLVVGQVSNIQMDAGPTAARLAEAGRGNLTRTLSGEMAEAAQAYARTKLKVKVDPVRARAAAGFAPEEKPASGKGGAEKKK